MNHSDMRYVLRLQKNEITEYHIYNRLADMARDPANSELLRRIAADEHKHYRAWADVSGRELRPSAFRIGYYVLLARVFGLAFGLRLMERGEQLANRVYTNLADRFPEFKSRILIDEQRHEKELIGLLNDVRLSYAGSIVLGLNDALVEFTGTLAGLTLAIPDTRLIGVTGLILGVAASLSMASSEFLSSREKGIEINGGGGESGTNGAYGANKAPEAGDRRLVVSPILSAIYTGASYIFTVVILTTPYFVTTRLYYALAMMLTGALVVIALYTFYISTARSTAFWPRFLEMLGISMGVALISFGVGWLLRSFVNVDV
jgi:VIT1/CCC1 family predicted Fe2+/Mn2+ transporter